MKKEELAYSISHREGVTFSQAERILHILAETIRIETGLGHEVVWPGVGVFVRREGRLTLEEPTSK